MEKLFLTIFTTKYKKVVKVEGEKIGNIRNMYGYTTHRTAKKMLKQENIYIEKEVIDDSFVFPDKYRYEVLNRLKDNFLIN